MLINPYSLIRILIPIYLLFLLIRYLRTPAHTPTVEQKYKPKKDDILIPKTIHQLLIDMPAHSVKEFKPNSHSISWQQSGWKVEYWSEGSCYNIAEELDEAQDNKEGSKTAGYAKTFALLPTAVLRSDFCRYLVMYGRGGVYNDLDVHLIRDLPWNVMTGEFSKENAHGGIESGAPSFIVGLEGDGKTTGLPRSPQFVQWTIVAVKGHGALKGVLDRIVERTPGFVRAMERDGDEKDLDIMNWTGPSVWTDAVLDYLDGTDEQVKKLKDLKQATRMGDVLVLPKRAFAVIQGEDHKNKDILVKHYFSGTWKKTCGKSWIGMLLPWGC